MTVAENLRKALFVAFLIILVLVLSLLFLLKYNVINLNSIYIGDNSVEISAKAKTQLDSVFIPKLINESVVCLSGEINSNGIKIRYVQETVYISTNATSVFYYPCPTYISGYKVIGTLHNHPNDVCSLSAQDLVTYGSDLRRGQEIIGIQCNDEYKFWVLSQLNSEVVT